MLGRHLSVGLSQEVLGLLRRKQHAVPTAPDAACSFLRPPGIARWGHACMLACSGGSSLTKFFKPETPPCASAQSKVRRKLSARTDLTPDQRVFMFNWNLHLHNSPVHADWQVCSPMSTLRVLPVLGLHAAHKM